MVNTHSSEICSRRLSSMQMHVVVSKRWKRRNCAYMPSLCAGKASVDPTQIWSECVLQGIGLNHWVQPVMMVGCVIVLEMVCVEVVSPITARHTAWIDSRVSSVILISV